MLKNNLRTHSPQKNENAVLTTAGYFEVSTSVRLQRQWKRVFTVYNKKKKVNTTIEFYIFKIFLVPNFSLSWQFWFFGLNLPKKGVSSLNKKK